MKYTILPGMTRQVMILGGTFNPIHFGHLIIARSVAERLGAEQVTLMPAHSPPHKAAGTLDGGHRLAMLKLAVEGDELFTISTLELDRTGASYTCDTLMQLRRHYGPDVSLAWVIGLDMLLDLANWHRAGEVVDLARVVTAARPPMPADLHQRLDALRQRFTEAQVRQLKQDVLTTPLIDISSSQIRRRVREGLSVRYLTPQPVVQYILDNRLYRL